MVPAMTSGVAFSANPLTGARDEVRVSATRGLADKLVAGEVDADEWSIKKGVATAIATAGNAIDGAMALRVADLARRCEASRGAPQDVEWAAVGDRLFVLQSRPITVLPVAPTIERPKGTWQKDAAHFPEPVAPFAASTHLLDEGQFSELCSSWGMLPDAIRVRVIGHELYLHVEPDDGGKAPPPWWLLAVLVRAIPPFRRKLAAAARAVREGWLESVPREWSHTQRAAQLGELERLAELDLTALDDDRLFDHVEELRVFALESMKLHFRLFVPYTVGVHELVRACSDFLGWSTSEAMLLLQGLSTASAETTRDLARVARMVRERPKVRALVATRSPELIARLDEVDREVAAELRRYVRLWGLRPFGPDAGSPTVAERPALLAGLLADLVEDDAMSELEEARLAAIDRARARLVESRDRLARFDAALAYAERVYAVREDNVLLTDQLPTGLLRRAALEIGRRLTGKRLLARAEDAVMLTASELRRAVRLDSDMKPLVRRRKSEIAWVRANPGPLTYGPPPGKTPDLRGLPEAARRINGALLWFMDQEVSSPPASASRAAASTLHGVAASPGIHRGRVRVIRSASELEKLLPGEVLVCPITTAAWTMFFQRAGALVADHGGSLSHTAIVAREYGLPAVVATSCATSALVDGEEVIVDGNRGTVERIGVTSGSERRLS
jgi:pyruvate,water dikinase